MDWPPCKFGGNGSCSHPVIVAELGVGAMIAPARCAGCALRQAPEGVAEGASAEESHPAALAPSTPRPPLRVAFVSYGWYLGGVETWTLALASHWSHKVRNAGLLLSSAETNNAEFMERAIGTFPVVSLNPADVLLNDQGERLADVAICWVDSHVEAVQRFAEAGGRVIAVSHDGQPDHPFSVHQRQVMAGLTREWVAVSPQAAAVVPTQGLGGPTRKRTILGGVDLRRIWSPPRLTSSRLRIGWVGRFHEDQKRPGWLPQVVRLVSEQLTEGAVGVAWGQGESEGELRAAKIDVREPQWQVGEALSQIDVLLITSTHEGGPLVALEALLAGVPVVSTPVGVVPELQGYHAKKGDNSGAVRIGETVAELARHCVALAHKRDHLRQSHFAQCEWPREWFAGSEVWAANRMAEQWERLLLSLPDGPGTRLMARLKAMGIAGANCGCAARAARMDQWGAARCLERLDEIVDEIMHHAGAWAWVPGARAVAGRLVRAACQ